MTRRRTPRCWRCAGRGGRSGEWRLTAARWSSRSSRARCAPAPLSLARVDRVVFGAYDPKAGAVGSLWDVVRDRRLNHRPEVVGGVLADECAALLRDFFAAARRCGWPVSDRPRAPVPSPAVACPSGRRSTPRKRVRGQPLRGFKSHRHRQTDSGTPQQRCPGPAFRTRPLHVEPSAGTVGYAVALAGFGHAHLPAACRSLRAGALEVLVAAARGGRGRTFGRERARGLAASCSGLGDGGGRRRARPRGGARHAEAGSLRPRGGPPGPSASAGVVGRSGVVSGDA